MSRTSSRTSTRTRRPSSLSSGSRATASSRTPPVRCARAGRSMPGGCTAACPCRRRCAAGRSPAGPCRRTALVEALAPLLREPPRPDTSHLADLAVSLVKELRRLRDDPRRRGPLHVRRRAPARPYRARRHVLRAARAALERRGGGAPDQAPRRHHGHASAPAARRSLPPRLRRPEGDAGRPCAVASAALCPPTGLSHAHTHPAPRGASLHILPTPVAGRRGRGLRLLRGRRSREALGRAARGVRRRASRTCAARGGRRRSPSPSPTTAPTTCVASRAPSARMSCRRR